MSNIPSPTELASIADDLEKQTSLWGSVDQLEFLVTILDKLTELDPKSNETASNFKWKLEFHPSDLRFLSEAFSTLADGLEYHDMESDGVLEPVEHIREMLSLKATKAVGRA